MKLFSRVLAILAFAFAGAFTAHAAGEDKIYLATGTVAEKSVYGIMGAELMARCNNNGEFAVFETKGGGTTNRQLLIENKIEMAFLQPDMLEFARRSNPASVENIRILAHGHTEEVHFIARADVKKEGGYVFGIKAKEVKFDTLSNLAGRTVGAVGGSVDTASVISNTSGLKFGVQRVGSTSELLKALLDGKFDAIAMVVGAPNDAVASLPASFKILPIPKDVQQRLVDSKMYTPAKLTYDNLKASGVDTVAVRSVIATRVYASDEMQQSLKKFRQCFYSNINALKDKRGTHPKWQSVDAKLQGGAHWYDLP